MEEPTQINYPFQSPKNKWSKKKILVILIIVILLPVNILAAINFFKNKISSLSLPQFTERRVTCLETSPNFNKLLCDTCKARGGKYVVGGWDITCEMQARDGDKQCTFDNQCESGVCIYQDVTAQSGRCDDYATDNFSSVCHRAANSAPSCTLDIQ